MSTTADQPPDAVLLKGIFNRCIHRHGAAPDWAYYVDFPGAKSGPYDSWGRAVRAIVEAAERGAAR